MLAELELGFDPAAERLETKLGQPSCRREGERFAPELLERGPAPQRECIAVEACTARGVGFPARRLGERLERGDVGSGAEGIAGRARLDRVRCQMAGFRYRAG